MSGVCGPTSPDRAELDVDHRGAVEQADRDRPAHALREFLHQRPRDLAEFHAGEQRADHAQRAGAEPVFGKVLVVTEVTELRERVRQPCHRRPRNPRARRHLHVAEHGRIGIEGLEHHQPLGKGGRKRRVAGTFGEHRFAVGDGMKAGWRWRAGFMPVYWTIFIQVSNKFLFLLHCVHYVDIYQSSLISRYAIAAPGRPCSAIRKTGNSRPCSRRAIPENRACSMRWFGGTACPRAWRACPCTARPPRSARAPALLHPR